VVGDHLRFPTAYWRHGCVFNVKRPLVRDHLQNATGDHHFTAKIFWMGDHFTFMCKPDLFPRDSTTLSYYSWSRQICRCTDKMHQLTSIPLSGKISWMHDHSSVFVRPNLLLRDSIFFKDCHSLYNIAGAQIFWQGAYQLTAFIEICCHRHLFAVTWQSTSSITLIKFSLFSLESASSITRIRSIFDD
jgi:hypothetical protein